MPTLDKYEIDPDNQVYFRRGYTHGVRAALDSLGRFLPEDNRLKLDVWFANELSIWGRDRRQSEFQAPEFPGLD
jgi:hypothetical protein